MGFERCIAEIKDRGNQAFTAAEQILFLFISWKNLLFQQKMLFLPNRKKSKLRTAWVFNSLNNLNLNTISYQYTTYPIYIEAWKKARYNPENSIIII